MYYANIDYPGVCSLQVQGPRSLVDSVREFAYGLLRGRQPIVRGRQQFTRSAARISLQVQGAPDFIDRVNTFVDTLLGE